MVRRPGVPGPAAPFLVVPWEEVQGIVLPLHLLGEGMPDFDF